MTNPLIIGVGHSIPSKRISNSDFVAMGIDTSNEWIVNRTGIENRYVIDGSESTVDLAFEASINAIQNASIDKFDIDLIIVATSSSDYGGFPSTACLLQNKLGLTDVGAFDLSAACSGFTFSLTTATQYIKTGMYQTILVVGVDVLSSKVDWTDRSTCILFGDAAGAVILQASDRPYGVVYSSMFADGTEAKSLFVPGGGSLLPASLDTVNNKDHFIKMDGKAVFKVAISKIVPAIKEALDTLNLTPSDVSYLICHQANKRILDKIGSDLGFLDHQVVMNLAQYGNTSAASIPLALSELNSETSLKKGDIIIFAGFGAGFTWGVNIIKWGI